MNLGIFLSIGSSFKDQKKSGQDKRFLEYYLKPYAKNFSQVFVFSYENESYKLPKNIEIVKNKSGLHRFFYTFLMPFFHVKEIKKVDVFRVMQLLGVLPALVTKIFFKKPFLVTFGYDYKAFAKLQGKYVQAFVFSFLEKLAVFFADGFIVTNKDIEVYLKNKYSKLNIYYIPNGIDTGQFKMKKGAVDFKKKSEFVILSVGRLEKQKNFSSLIKAASFLEDKKRFKLLLVGRGSLESKLKKLAKKLKVNLKIINFVSHSKIQNIYKKADLFCLPSFLEGHPKVLLEAMASGLPCIMAKIPGMEEFEDKKEVLLVDTNPESISKGISLLFKKPGLVKTLKENARVKVSKDFNIKNLLQKEIKILKNV
jgi:glycosyltransferase involved in cell wall biosynthesis